LKFLCDQCKAKYQIADDKIAGKTVRMKCRKCGHQIEVRAAVTETSVSTHPPKPDKPVDTVKTPFGTAGAAPRPGAPRPGGLATSLSAAKPAAPKAQPREGGALAGAFNRTVQRDEPSNALELLEISAADEWYAAINSVPVGPIRMAELRRKAAAGTVNEDTLVWQEGMEEWRPVRSIPELAAIVREAAAGGRPSLVSSPDRQSQPPPRVHPTPTPAPGPSPLQRIAKPAQTPAPVAAPPTARSNVVPITSRLATAEKLAPLEPAPISIAPDPFAVPPAPAAAAMSPPVMTPQAPQAPLAPQASLPGQFAPSMVPPEPAKKGPPWIAIAMIALAVAFGATAGIALFLNKQQPPPQPVVIQMQQPTAPPVATTAAPPQPETPTTPTIELSATPTSPSTAKTAVATGPKPATTSTSKGSAVDVSGLLGGANGPVAGPGGPGGSSGGSSLTADQIQAVVRNRSAGVKRTCWERGGGEKAGTVSVRVNLTVAGNGQVTDASASGPDAVMNKCIENQVRTWQFPPTGGTSRVEIPFHFVQQ
jgi:predicted Zn finger-like uncharacterized protein